MLSPHLDLGLQSGAFTSGFTQKSCLHLFCTMWDTLLGLVATKYSATLALGIDSASTRNEYQEYFLGVKAAGA